MKEFKIQRDFIESILSDKQLDKRLMIYKDLTFNNIEDTLSKAFPITKTLIEESWENITYKFIKNYPIKTPYLWEVPKDFLEFFKKENFQEKRKLPFLDELLEYEWLEIDIFNTDIPQDVSEFSWSKRFFLSSSCVIKTFSYPVHRIGSLSPEDIIKQKSNYFLIIYNNYEDMEVSYIQLTEFLFDIVSNISKDTTLEVVKQTCQKYSIPFEEIAEKIEKFLNLLCQERIIV